ncbi:glycosyltransferase [Halorussus halophilus]|uniref:glycosyltransferase n=1 Tax=Halorussus halophilus TaxID=2650975 RepID=UPI0013011E31|nr:glycosyltransferase [Halorussus halophilus]
MKALQLTTTPRPFFDQQVAALEERGIECETLSVPRTGDDGRSPDDYLRYLPQVLGESADYDLVHANYGLVAPYALGAARRAGAPLVITFWGTDLMGPTWLRRLSTATAKFADGVVLPSRAMDAHLDDDYTYVPFGVDTDMFRPIPRDEARERVGWSDEEYSVLFPYDTDRPEKDYERAKKVVTQSGPDAELRTISGVEYEEMPYYMNAADALIVTSERESGPMVVKEAAACNVPVVSTDVGFVRETIEGVEGSAVCTTDEELVAGLETAFDAERSDGRDSIPCLSVNAMGDRLAGLYDRVCSGADAGVDVSAGAGSSADVDADASPGAAAGGGHRGN